MISADTKTDAPSISDLSLSVSSNNLNAIASIFDCSPASTAPFAVLAPALRGAGRVNARDVSIAVSAVRAMLQALRAESPRHWLAQWMARPMAASLELQQ